jgi:SAM-dependent methyltransferase
MRQWLNERGNYARTPGEVFTEIYAGQLWGTDEEGVFFSGPGSTPEAAAPYAAFVRGFMAEHGLGRVVDLGCGDFRVGRLIAPACARYIGVDVVRPLIEENTRRHGSATVTFQCLDITADTLPNGELCLIREVFQHLSNADVLAVLRRVRKYPFVLVTDVQPKDHAGYRVNRDKARGAGSRLLYRSLLRLDQPPFNVTGVRAVFATGLPRSADDPVLGTNFYFRTFLIRHDTVMPQPERA